MADIKITLSTNTKLRTSSIEDERKWLRKEGKLFYPLGTHRPKRAERGDWLYFILGGRLVARAQIDAIEPPPTWKRLTFSGAEEKSHPWLARISSMEVVPEEKRIHQEGFRSFRYVRPEEQAEFERTFR